MLTGAAANTLLNASDLVAVLFHAGSPARMALVRLSGCSKDSHLIHFFFADIPSLFVGKFLLFCRKGVIRKTRSRHKCADDKHGQDSKIERHGSLLFASRADRS